MVIEKSWVVYACPYCSREYDDEDDAIECANDCIDIDPPEEVDKFGYICEMCNEQHQHEEEAEKCESDHKRKEDMLYQSWVIKKREEHMAKIANHPNQVKLEKWGLVK